MIFIKVWKTNCQKCNIVGNISKNAIHISGIPKQTISASKLPKNCHIYCTKECNKY